jgi:hypothetical protein
MSMSQDQLIESALSLPHSERAELVVRLQQSLDKSGEVFDLTSVIDDVRKITQEIFPGKCEFTHEYDYEYPEDQYVVVNVESSGEPKELVDRSCAWHKRIGELSVDLSDKLRLSIVPR